MGAGPRRSGPLLRTGDASTAADPFGAGGTGLDFSKMMFGVATGKAPLATSIVGDAEAYLVFGIPMLWALRIAGKAGCAKSFLTYQ